MALILNEDDPLTEIYLHVKKIKEEQERPENINQENIEPYKIIQETSGVKVGETDEIAYGPEDVFEIIGPVDDEEPGNIGNCDLCGKGMLFEKNPSGLVVHEKFFVCAECCQQSSQNELNTWMISRMAKPDDVKPIALWLMERENKTKLF